MARSLPFLNGFNPFTTFASLWAKRDLLFHLVQRNIEGRYKGSVIGLVWAVVTPLFLLAVYTFFFSVIFKAHWGADFGDSKIAFSLILFCGLALFNIFSESVMSSVSVVTSNVNYVKKVVFPLEVLPVALVLSAAFLGLLWFGVLISCTGLFLHKPALCLMCLPLVFAPLLLLSCGVSWLVASLGVYTRDLSHVIGLLLQSWIFLTPIFYPIEMVPTAFRRILLLNPLAILVQSARAVLIYNQWPNWRSLAEVTLLSLIIFQLGYSWFMKTKRGFADVL